PLYISRYLIVALPALYLLMLWIIGNLPRRLPLSIGVILVAAMSLTLTQQAISQSTPVKENYAGVSEYLERSVSPQDVVVLSAPFTIYPMEYYYGGSAPLETLPQWNRFESGDAPAYQSSQLASGVKSIGANHKFAWVVLSYDQGNNEEIRRYYDSNYERISQREFSPGLTVYQYRLRYDIPDTEKLIESLNK
ncbi:MAG TPA: hypothetical protein VK963_00570, partial [Candidatus Saccharimonadales bacterium]|nr:hypothetical protein [Candidatus Saccharimonadales bacterium]